LSIEVVTPRLSAVALRHVAFEDLGFLSAVLDRAGWTVSYCDAAVSDLRDPILQEADLLTVLGGPIGVYESEAYPFLLDEVSLLERRLAQDQPTLGVCLGSQLMARALGARVFAGSTKEIGWGPIILTAAGRSSCLRYLPVDANVLHWHGDTFDLPDGATRLASTANYENQAFAWGAYGLALQFHLEVEPRWLEEWYVGHRFELEAAGIAVPALRAVTQRIAPGLQKHAEDVFGAWLQDHP
jgi:GMP synthase (glutamine-hydrolysing)